MLEHLRYRNDGSVVGITAKGTFTIAVLALDVPPLVEFRRRMIQLASQLERVFSPNASKPVANLPDDELSALDQVLRTVAEGWGLINTTVDKITGVATIVRAMSARLCELIARRPHALEDVEWRDLERIIAEALEGIGFSVELTPPSKDGGKDVVARCFVGNSTKKFNVEIKHWRRGSRPGTRQISEFIEINARDKTDGGLFLSSSGFTESVYRQLDCISRERIRLGESEKIVAICQHYIMKQQGIWLPQTPLPEVLFADTLG